MRVRRKLLPGQPSTKKLVEKYGANLLCIRYRYDSERKRKIKTVELIEDEGPWEINSTRIPKNKIMKIRIHYEEVYLRKIVKSVGGRWNKEKKVWELSYGEILQLGLEGRIIKE